MERSFLDKIFVFAFGWGPILVGGFGVLMIVGFLMTTLFQAA